MSSQHEFLFNREEIESQINALYELDAATMDARAEDEDPRVYDGRHSSFAFTSSVLQIRYGKQVLSKLERRPGASLGRT